MKFDTVIIGGGLSGLTCGVRLAERGQRCAIVSAGQSALHFCSGSFDLLGYVDEEEVENPLEALTRLPAQHPYSLLGVEKVKSLSQEVVPFFESMGVAMRGAADKNHYRITPTGNLRLTWLTEDEYLTVPMDGEPRWKNVVILNVAGFLDFPTEFIAQGLENIGVNCRIKAFSLPELEVLRKNPTEMRSANIARVFETEETVKKLAAIIDRECAGADAAVLPSVFGLYTSHSLETLRKEAKTRIEILPALPPSVPGIRIQMQMRRRFQALGGTYLLGDNVTGGTVENGQLLSVKTVNHGDITMEADNFVLASGSFFSHGIAASPTRVYEPVFGLDVTADEQRSHWFNRNLFDKQPYMGYGVATDATFQAQKNGEKISNLYVAGSVLGGADSIKEACGAGISLLTSLNVASEIIKKSQK